MNSKDQLGPLSSFELFDGEKNGPELVILEKPGKNLEN